MSRHWKPDGDPDRWTRADGHAWPEGATAGLLLVAAGCLLVGALVYKATGPRDFIEKNAADWSKGLPSQ